MSTGGERNVINVRVGFVQGQFSSYAIRGMRTPPKFNVREADTDRISSCPVIRWHGEHVQNVSRKECYKFRRRGIEKMLCLLDYGKLRTIAISRPFFWLLSTSEHVDIWVSLIFIEIFHEYKDLTLYILHIFCRCTSKIFLLEMMHCLWKNIPKFLF